MNLEQIIVESKGVYLVCIVDLFPKASDDREVIYPIEVYITRLRFKLEGYIIFWFSPAPKP